MRHILWQHSVRESLKETWKLKLGLLVEPLLTPPPSSNFGTIIRSIFATLGSILDSQQSWEVSACKMEPQSCLFFQRNHPPTHRKHREWKNEYRRAQADLSHVLSMLCGVPTLIVPMFPPSTNYVWCPPFQYMFFPHHNCFSTKKVSTTCISKCGTHS